MRTYKLNWVTVKYNPEEKLSEFWNNTYTQPEFYDLVKNNIWERPKYKKALTIIYEAIFEDCKSSIIEIIW